MSKLHEQALRFLRKAEADLALLDEVLPAARVSPDIIGFHCQQAAEKLLKALLSERGIAFPRTHNLQHLLDLLADAGHELPLELCTIDELTPYGTVFRYDDPEDSAAFDRGAAVRRVRALYTFVQPRILSPGS
jgi:HEPN domain-containing protein